MKPHLASVYFLIKWKKALALCIYPDKDSLSSRARGGLLAFFPLRSLVATLLRLNSYVVQFNKSFKVCISDYRVEPDGTP